MSERQLLVNRFAEMSLGSLFHQPEFFRLHAGGKGLFFQWESDGKVEASIHFTEVATGVWRSPARGTYAGYAAAADLGLDQLFAFHEAVEAELVRRGAASIEVLPAPMAHDPEAFSKAFYLLRSRGFSLDHCDLNHAMAVTAVPLADRMTYGNRKRVRKAEREGLTVRQVGMDCLPAVYDTIAANRAMKGNTVSMQLEQLEEMARLFPDRMLLFAMPDGEQYAASAICLRLSKTVLYVFYWGDRPGYSALSPVVALAAAIYGYCQETGIGLLDAGTSTVDREPNHGLIQFKRNLGFEESLKVRMVKSL